MVFLSSYLQAIVPALWLFPAVAALFTLPYMAVQYRRFGAILMLRTIIVYSFILYLMCASFLTILPLPSIEKVRGLTSKTIQLIPFYDWYVWLSHSGFVLTQPGTWLKLIWNRDLFQLLANILLTLPLGVYLRYYFHRTLKQTVLISLGVSLVFELTQLTGLFFIYPRPYRLCEVDDLMTNTFGGMIGYWLAGPLTKILPTTERMNAVAYRRGQHVSVTRRLTAALVDWAVLGTVFLAAVFASAPLRNWLLNHGGWGFLIAMAILYAAAVLLYFMVGEWLQRGYTPGKRLMRLRLIDDRDGSRPKLWQCIVRYGVLYDLIAPVPAATVALLLLSSNATEEQRAIYIIACVVLLVIYATFVVMVAIHVLTRSNQLPHGELSKTRNISTLRVTPEMLGEDKERKGDKHENQSAV